MTVPTYKSDEERYAAIHAGVLAKLAPRRPDLAAYSGDVLAHHLIQEALAEHYEDAIARNYAWDLVERIVYRAIEQATGERPPGRR